MILETHGKLEKLNPKQNWKEKTISRLQGQWWNYNWLITNTFFTNIPVGPHLSNKIITMNKIAWKTN